VGERVFTLKALAESIDARLVGDEAREVTGPGSLGSAQSDQVTHLSSASFRSLLPETQAAAVILREADLDDCPTNALVVDNPYLAYARMSQLFVVEEPLAQGIHPSADISPDASVDPTARIGPGVQISEGSTVGARVRIYANAVVGANCHLGDDVTLMPNAVLYSSVRIGARSIIHSGAIIGADGFGFTPGPEGRLQAIAQLGGVTLGEEVSVGACTTIDRGAIEDTVIDDGVKIDNQVQIGHNSRIGAHTMICGCVGIVGSTTIGRHCVLAGGVGVGGTNPIEICDHVVLSATTFVTSSITKPGFYSGGNLHAEHNAWRRNAIRLLSLDALAKKVNTLEKKLAVLTRED
jgi:UDP-3-O-[3-hydroxymyristoyl] glucosamine N-acyltransferase